MMALFFALAVDVTMVMFFFSFFAGQQHLGSFLRWALRVAPSSGNLQTTEVHLVLPAMEGLANVTAVQLF